MVRNIGATEGVGTWTSRTHVENTGGVSTEAPSSKSIPLLTSFHCSLPVFHLASPHLFPLT